MLDEYRSIYEENANLIKNWRSLSKLELCNGYLNNSDNLIKDSYLSALICACWSSISKLYYAQRIKLASEEDVYAWFIDGILTALNNHPWTNPENKLYNDPEGPDKAIKVCIYSAKINFFNSLNYEKRKISKYSVSLDELSENSSDDYYLPTTDTSPYMEMYIYDKVRTMFLDYDYFSSFLLDAIVNIDVFSFNDDHKFFMLSNRKLIKYLRHIDKKYIKIFSEKYNLNEDQVTQAAEFISNLSVDRMTRNISNLLFILSKDKDLLNYIKS